MMRSSGTRVCTWLPTWTTMGSGTRWRNLTLTIRRYVAGLRPSIFSPALLRPRSSFCGGSACCPVGGHWPTSRPVLTGAQASLCRRVSCFSSSSLGLVRLPMRDRSRRRFGETDDLTTGAVRPPRAHTQFYPDSILRGAGVYVDTYAYDSYQKYDMTGVRRGTPSVFSPRSSSSPRLFCGGWVCMLPGWFT